MKSKSDNSRADLIVMECSVKENIKGLGGIEKALAQISDQQPSTALTVLASAVFRRDVRGCVKTLWHAIHVKVSDAGMFLFRQQ